MSNEQLSRLFLMLCIVVVIAFFWFFYTIYQLEHQSMMRLKTEYENTLLLYKTRLEECRND
jgi:hypothetical protein